MDALLKTALLDPASWKQIDGYLDQLLDLEPSLRERWLTDLAATQPGVANLLDKLLHAPDSGVGELLDGTPIAARELAAAHASMVGKQIGPYTVERLIGRGGMGAVWLAKRSDGRFEGSCAIKLIDGVFIRPDLADRFSREGRLLARLSHPNIARLVDAGTLDDGRQFLVLEYIAGERIDHYCKLNGLGVSSRVRLFLGAVAAVTHAHSHLVIHRDLKPSNVLVTDDGTVKLLDFGIAKLLSTEQAPDDAMPTQVEQSALTPEFAAPEQLLGEMPSTATDVYQLGMLLYVLLTDKHPLELVGTRSERIKAALAARIRPPSHLTHDAALRKELSGDLDAIVAKALDPDATRRYPTAAALQEDLVRYLHGEPVAARRGATLYHVRKFVGRHRLSVAISAAALIALCVLSIYAFRLARIATQERDQAIAMASRNTALSDFMGTLITESDEDATVGDIVARSERLALLDSSGTPENRAAILELIAVRYHDLGNFSKAAELTERGLALIEDSPAADLRAKMRCGYALTISRMGRADEARRIIARELEEPSSDPAARGECLGNRADLAFEEGDADAGLRYALQALATVRLNGPVSAVAEASFLGNVARGYRMQGRYREALQSYELMLQNMTKIGREWSPTAVAVRSNFALFLESAGVPKRALELQDELLGVLAKRDEPPPVNLLVNRGRSLESLGRFEQARAADQHALEAAVVAKQTNAQMNCLAGLARIAIDMRELAAAEEYLNRATRLLSSPQQIEKFPVMSLALGELALARDKLDEAGQRFEQAAATKTNLSAVVYAQLGKAEVSLRMGDPTAAVRYASAALDIAKSLQAGLPHSQLVGRSWLMLGRARLALGDRTQAHQALENAVSELSNTVDSDHPLLAQASVFNRPGP